MSAYAGSPRPFQQQGDDPPDVRQPGVACPGSELPAGGCRGSAVLGGWSCSFLAVGAGYTAGIHAISVWVILQQRVNISKESA